MKTKFIAAAVVALLSMGIANSADAAPWRNHGYGHGGGYGHGYREHRDQRNDRGFRHGHGGGYYGGGQYGGSHYGGGHRCYR